MGHPIGTWASVLYDIKKYYGFNPEESRNIAVAILVMGLTLSVGKLFVDYETLAIGIKDFMFEYLNSILLVTLTFLVYISVQRIVAIRSGVKPEWRIWMYGLLIGLALAFVSRGKLWFLVPGSILVYHMEGHRITSFRYGLNFWPLGLSSIMGPISCVLLAIIFKLLLYASPQNPLLLKAISINIWFAIINMLPIPPIDGSNMFFASRMVYVFSFAFVLGLGISMLFFNILVSLIIGLLAGVALWQLLYWTLERGD